MNSERATRRYGLFLRQGVPLLIALGSFLIYCSTLARTVDFIDSGELATVACTLGIAHPTGYPLFTLLGAVFSRLPIAGEQIVRLNLMAASFCAFAVFLFIHLMRLLLIRVGQRSPLFGRVPRESFNGAVAGASGGAGILLAFSQTFWAQAVAVEVYSLHLLLVSAVLLVFFKASFDWRVGGERWWYFFAFLLGLCFSNHMTTILLGPGLLYCYFAMQGGGPQSWRRIGRMAAPFVLGLSVYAYLPLRASQSPLMNWGNPVTPERLLWHLSGKQFRVWIFSSTSAAAKQLGHFIDTLPAEFTVAGLVIAAVGAVVLWFLHRKLLLTTSLLFAVCVLYSINYDIQDIDSYFLLAYATMAIWAGVGLLWGWTRLTRLGTWRVSLVYLLCLLPLMVNYSAEDESNDYLVDDYTHNMFASLGKDAIVLSYQWDYWVSASFYYQIVRGERPDCVVIDKELLRRSWYLQELAARYPWLIRQSQQDVDAFLLELYKFEHGLPYNDAVIEGRYAEMIASFIRKNIASRPVYVTGEIEEKYTRGFQRVPGGLAFRLYGDTLFHPEPEPEFRVRPFDRRGRLEDMVRRLYADAWTARGEYYYYRRSDAREARKAFLAAISYDPTSPLPKRWLAALR